MRHKIITGLFQIFFLFFIGSFFLTLGADFQEQVYFRIGLGGILAVAFFLFLRKEGDPPFPKNLTVVCFFCFLGFELVRFLWAILVIEAGNLGQGRSLLFFQYLSSPALWALYFVSFLLSFSFFKTKSRVNHLLWVLSCSGFILAMNAIPPLLIQGHAGYVAGEGRAGFFHPAFYFYEPLSKYLFSRFSHVNYTGDVIALGFFPALGLFFYGLYFWRKKKEAQHKTAAAGDHTFPPVFLGFPAIFSGATALAVILFFSRGTIVCFSLAFLLYLLAVLTKFPSRIQCIFSATALLLVLGFLFWAGNLQKVGKEIQTLKKETDAANKDASFLTNREGALRAIRIYRAYPLWGVGTDGYAIVSLRFATPKTMLPSSDPDAHPLVMAEFRALCHYLQLLAEEGVGAYLYFLFLLVYFFEALRGLWGTKSHFQFMSSLSLLAPVFMVLSHAAINQLMQQFSISVLIYVFMGATLAILRPDFKHS